MAPVYQVEQKQVAIKLPCDCMPAASVTANRIVANATVGPRCPNGGWFLTSRVRGIGRVYANRGGTLYEGKRIHINMDGSWDDPT